MRVARGAFYVVFAVSIMTRARRARYRRHTAVSAFTFSLSCVYLFSLFKKYRAPGLFLGMCQTLVIAVVP